MAWAWWLSAAFAVAIVVMAVVSLHEPPSNPMDRITQACREQFPFDQSGRIDCETRTAARFLNEVHRDRLDAAYQRAR